MANINAQFNYSANFGPVIGQMQKLTAEANLLNNTLQNLDKQAVGLKTSLASSFASDLGKIGGYNAKMIELTDSVDQFGQSLLKQKLTLKQYAQEAIGAFSKSSNAHKLAVREVSREMSQLVTLGKGMDGKQMGMMITPATINLKDFNTQLAVSQKQWSIFNSLVQDGTTHLINFGKNTQWAGRQITVGLTVPLTIYGNTVSKIFREVDAELTRFKKVYGSDLMNSTSDATDQMVSDVRNLAVEFSRSMGIAAKDTAALAADLAATGLEGQKLLAALRETTRLAVLGDVSNQDAMKTTLSLQNAFKISTDELAESVNFLNAVENQTSLSLQDLTTAIPKAGPVIKSLGGDVKDLSLLMVALKEGGISAAEGANALKSGMASLINPTKQASATAKQYGIDINQIVQANRGQLMPTIMAFQQQLELLDDFGKAQVIENVFGKYQFARLSALFDNLNASASQTNAVLGLMGQSSKELSATAYQEMDTLMNSSSKRFQRAIEGIKAQFITIGESITTSIIPIVENLSGKIGKAIEFFQNLPKPIKSFIKVAVGLTAVAGPIIMMVGIFSNFLGYIGKGAMGMVNLGRRMAGIPTEKFDMLTDTQIMAAKATQQLSDSFNTERSSVERLNQALSIYRQNLVDAISLNPAFVNRQMPAPKATTSGLDIPPKKLQRGGSAWVPGSGDGDKVPAMLEPGEYVVNKKAAAKYSETLDQINFQSAPRFQKGGRMPGYGETSMLPYESVSGQGKKAQPFIGPLPQISYGIQGSYMPGGYTPFVEYPFSSRESAEAFQATDPRKYGGRASRITRDINDPQQQAYADWIAGHNSNQFRTGTGVMKRLDMEGHRDQMLRSMGPISQSIPLYRGTVLREKGANEFSGVGARELLMYIKHGMFEKAMGKKIQWSDMQSFSSNPNIASYNKFIESWTNPSNTNSKKAADRQLASMEMLPIIFRLASAKGQTGFNLSERALVQEVGMGDVVDEKEWVLNSPSGTITGIRQDMGTKNYIIDLMQNGGRVQSHADESLMPEKYSKKMENIQSIMDATSQEASGGMYAGMPMTDIGNLVDRIGGRSAAIPGASGIYEQGGVRSVVKGHSTATSARIEAIASALTRSIFGLESPVQEFIKFGHPETSSPMFGVRSPFDAKFAKTSGKIGAGDFFMQALSAIIRGDSDLQPDNLYDGIVVDQGAGYGSDRASQPRGLTGKKFSVGDQAKVNFLMQKGGARRWFTEATAGIASGMTREQYIGGFMQAISQAQANFPAAMASLAGMNLTKEEQEIFGVLARDLQGAQGIDWGSIYDSHIGVTPEVKKPVTEAAAAKALLTKQANKEEYEKATAAGYPSWMGYAQGGRINGYQDVSTMFYGTGHGIKKAAAPKDWKKAIFAGLDSPLVKKRSSNASNLGLANSSRIEIAHTKSDVYKKVLGYNAKQWDGSEIFEVGLINNLLNMLDGTGAVGKFAQKWMGNAVNVQPDSKTEGTRLFNALGKAIPHLGDKDAPKGNSRNWILKAHEFLSNPENIDYYSQKVKINDFIRGSVSPLQTLNEDIPKNIKEKIKGMQSGGRLNGYATETTTWAKKAAAPKAYAGVLQNIPNWATKPAEYQAIVEALRAAGVPESDRLASFYIQDVLAHINPSTTNENGIYEKVWSAANLMKDSQVYNVFLETLRTRKDIGGLLNPSTVSRVAGASGLSASIVQAELTKIADGVHPNTANGAKVMMTLARMFPSRTSPGMPIAVAAGMGARLQGNFYDTLGQRALPSNLPNTTVRAYDPKGTGAPTSTGQGSRVRSTGLIMPSGAIRPSIVMPNIQSIPSAAGGTGTSATVKVDGMGNVLSNGIDDMVAKTITGQPIAVSSKELLAIGPGGGIAGVTSPGDEARGNIVHPIGTALIRGKNFQEKRLRGFATTSAISGLDIMPEKPTKTAQQNTEPVFEGKVSPGSMGEFGGNAFMMISVMQQMSFAISQFTSETQNGTSKLVAGMNLFLTASQAMSGEVGEVLGGLAKARQASGQLGEGGVPLDNRGKPITKMSSGIGKAMGGISGVANKLGTFPVQIGLQLAIMAVTKGIELYQKAMENAKKTGNAAFKEPTETAKLLGVELKSLTSGAEKLGKAAEKIFGAQGKGSYDKAFEKVVKTDYEDLITVVSKGKTEQEQLNQLTNVYGNLIQRGFDPKSAKEVTAEIARQSQAMGAFNKVSGSLDNIKNSKDAVKAQLDTFQSQMGILEERRKLATKVGAKDVASGAFGALSMLPGVSLVGRAVNAGTGSAIKTQSSDLRADAVNEFFGVQGDEFYKRALRGTGLDRNPLAQALGGYLADQTMKTQMAAQLGATIKSIFSIAADNPTASNEALRMLVTQFKTVDWKKASEELASIAEEKGFGDLSQIGQFVQSDTFKNLGEENQTVFLAALNAGLGPQLEKDLANGWGNVDWQKIAGQAAENQALVAIDVEVDIQLQDSIDQLALLKTAIQQSFTAAIEAKQKELEFEDLRHEKTLKNLDQEAERLGLKKELLARNTEYYIKELQKEKEAEDFYSKQRQTGLGGLKALSQGDVFGFIGAQMEAATTADQFGRDRSIQNIQETSDAAQAKIDQEMKGIEDRKAAESARHEAEVKNINAEIAFLQQKQSASVGSVDKATKLLEKAMAMSPGDKGYQQAITDAQAAADQAGVNGQQIMQELKITSADKDIQKRIDEASKTLGDSLTIIANDTTNAVDRLNAAGTIASNVFESLNVDPAKSKAYKDLFDTLQKPLDPTVSAAIQAFTYGSVNNQDNGTLNPNTPAAPTGGGATSRFSSGGMLSGPGNGTSDSIPIMASNGEYIFRADVVKRIGKARLDQINSGNFAYGGMVGSMPGMSSAPSMATGGFVGSMPSYSSAPGMAAGGFIGNSAPSTPKYNIPSAGGGMSPSPIAQMARGGMVGGSSTMNSNAPTQNFHFSGAGMDMVMHHVNKAIGGRISSNSRRIG